VIKGQSLDINAITKKVFEEAKDVIIAWFSVLSQGPAAIEKLDLGASPTVLFALRFLFYVALVDFAVAIPSVASSGVKYDDEVFIGVSLAAIYIEYLSLALILYGALKLFGGKARVEECVAAFCFLTAYLPLAAILRLPTVPIGVKAIDTSANYPEAVGQGAVSLLRLSRWDLSVFLLSTVLATGVFVLFLIYVFRCFRRLHGLPRPRALLAFALGLMCAFVFALAFVIPFDGAIDRAFARK
jgi:hypothetical protein